MRSNKGITLTTLVVTVIILFILTGIATYTGIEVLTDVRRTAFITELQTIQEKVNLYNEKGGYESLGDSLILLQLDGIDIKSTTGVHDISANSRYFTKDTLKQIEVEGIDQEVVIDFEKRIVVSVYGIKLGDKYYYTLEQLGINKIVEYNNKNSGTIDFNITAKNSIIQNSGVTKSGKYLIRIIDSAGNKLTKNITTTI